MNLLQILRSECTLSREAMKICWAFAKKINNMSLLQKICVVEERGLNKEIVVRFIIEKKNYLISLSDINGYKLYKAI